MKRFAMALTLMCALSTPILAGNMPTGGKSEEPPPPTTSSTPGETQSPPGETHTPPGATQGPSLVTTILLTIITWAR